MNYTYFVNLGSWFFISFVVFLVLGSIVSNVIGWLNSEKFDLKKRLSKIHELGGLAKKLFSSRKVNKALNYKNAIDGFEDTVGTINSGVSTLVIIFGIVPFMVSAIWKILPEGTGIVWGWIIASVLSVIFSTVAGMPSDYYKDFVIEKNFGFNKKTTRTFFTDAAKYLVVGCSITVVMQYLIYLGLKLFGIGETGIANIAFFVCLAVLLGKILQWFFINAILPMFNKFEPLKDKKLKRKIETLCKKCKFNVSKIEVMDASKRNNHSNAFICGSFGKKRIVLFDTILKNMTHDEILAIVAHEIGHGKLHHLLYKNIEMIVGLTIYTVISFSLMKIPEFYNSFGYSWVTENNVTENYVIGFSLASAFVNAFSWILTPLSNWLSRKMEYAADRFAADNIENGKSLENALIKLTSENLSDVIPHPVYEFVNYSHPSILNRILAIRKNEEN